MQLIPINLLREGQTVARDVRDPRGRILLARGQRLSSSHIARLRKFDVEAVYLRDGYGESGPELLKSEVKERCVDVLSGSIGNLSGEMARKQLDVNPMQVKSATEGLIDAILGNGDPLVTLLDLSTGADGLMQHSVNSAVLAVILAMDMRVPGAMISHLASAMLFHDVGMALLPEEITQKSGRLTPGEADLLRGHVNIGCRQLVQSQAVSSVAANIILRHHEAMDGSGYPSGVGADKLSILSRIACVAEVYDAMTSPRPYAPAVMPDAALTYILRYTGSRFAREAVLALCRRVALYPTGTAVQLNTGETGVVAGTPAEAPTRPVVHLYFDHRGRKFPSPQLLDLGRDPGRTVLRSAPNLPALAKARGSAPPPQIDPLAVMVC